ncbi:MAG TPA: hypothetical protein VHA06_09060, partial [Candidatus Angelobacter sp.]|nr:hypothetical protein [Candidatus Angelobacter sp.]
MPDPVDLTAPTQNTIPQQSAPAPDVMADPRAGLGGPSPDMSPLSSLAQQPQGDAATPELANQHGTLKAVLHGVALSLAGAAAGMGQKRPGEAAAAGVQTGIGLAQQAKENTRADVAQKNQTSESQSRVKFQNVQAAEATARAAMYDKQLHQMDQTFQDEHNSRTLGQMKELQEMGITPTIVSDNHGQGANSALEQLTQSHGGVPNMFILNLGDKLVGYDMKQLGGMNAMRDQVNSIAKIQGKGDEAYTASAWGMMSPEAKGNLVQSALGFFNPMPTKDNADNLLQQYKNYKTTYGMNPNADPATLKKLDDTIKLLDSSRSNFVQQKGQEAASVAAAEAPGKVALAGAEETARIGADLKAADLDNKGMRLYEGLDDVSQLSKRARTYDAEIEAADRYGMKTYGKHFDAAKAQSDYGYAKNVGTQNTLKYLNSLTGN